ncbi:MAG: hypothetical protein ACLFU8_10210 [Anaerolineales bacterium]
MRPKSPSSVSSRPKSKTPRQGSELKSQVSKDSRPAPSASPSTAQDLRAERQARLSTLSSNWSRVAGTAALTTVLDRMEDVGTRINTLDHRVERLRARGYIFGRGWEDRARTFKRQWPTQQRTATRSLQQERNLLGTSVNDVNNLIDRANRNPSLLDAAEDRIWDLERQVREAEQRVAGAFDQTQNELWSFETELRSVESMLDAFEEAKFQLFPEEHPVAATEAEWLAKGTEPIPGHLFLTEGRLLFEQRQEVATKKFLFITTEKEKVQELLWQGPIGGIEVLETQDEKGFLKARQELLTLRMEGGDAPPQVALNLKGADNDEWARLLRRAREGQFEAERYDSAAPSSAAVVEEQVAPVEATTAAEVSVPTKCPSCGAQLPTIYKGMQQVTCDYCGTVVSL